MVPDDFQVVPGWSPDDPQMVGKKIEKKAEKSSSEIDTFVIAFPFFSIKYRRATAPSFSLQCLMDGCSNLAQGYILRKFCKS